MHITFYEGMPPAFLVPRLVEKAYAQGQRGVLWVENEGLMAVLDDALWTFSKVSFVPHGCVSDGIPPSEQPFWLTPRLENPNEAHILFCVQCAQVNFKQVEAHCFSRCVWLFEYATAHHKECYRYWIDLNQEVQWWTYRDQKWQISNEHAS